MKLFTSVVNADVIYNIFTSVVNADVIYNIRYRKRPINIIKRFFFFFLSDIFFEHSI